MILRLIFILFLGLGDLTMASGETLPSSGKVVDGEGRRPIAGAMVLVGARGPYPKASLTRTGTDGNFESVGLRSNAQSLMIYRPGYSGYLYDPTRKESPEQPEIVLEREIPSPDPPSWYRRILDEASSLSYFQNDRGLNPKIRLSLLRESVPGLELMAGRIEREALVRTDVRPPTHRIFDFEWRDVVERDLVAPLEEFLKRGGADEKMLALAMLAPPACRDFSEEYSEAYQAAIADPHPLVREMALIMIRRRVQESAEHRPFYLPLPDHLAVSRVVAEPREAESSRVWCISPPLMTAVRQALKDPEPQVRMEAAVTLGVAGEEDDLPALATMAGDADPFVRAAVAFAVGELGVKEGIPVLARMAAPSSPTPWPDFIPKTEALRGLRKIMVRMSDVKGKIPDQLRQTATRCLVDALKDHALYPSSIAALAGFRAPEAVPALKSAAGDPDPRIRELALTGLLRTAEDPACTGCFDVFRHALNDPDRRVQISAIRGLGAFKGEEATSLVVQRLAADGPDVRRAAAAALPDPRPEAIGALLSLIEREQAQGDSQKPPARESLRQLALRALHHLALQRRDTWLLGDDEGKGVARRLLPIYPSFQQTEKLYALEVIALSPQEGLPFLQEQMRSKEEAVRIRAMAVGAAYYPKEALLLIAGNAVNAGWDTHVASLQLLRRLVGTLGPGASEPLSRSDIVEVRELFFTEAAEKAGTETTGTFLAGLADPEAKVRAAATTFFLSHTNPKAIPLLVQMLDGSDSTAALALTKQDRAVVSAVVLATLQRRQGDDKKDLALKKGALRYLPAGLPVATAVDAVAGILRDYPDSELEGPALYAVQRMQDPAGVPLAEACLRRGCKHESAAISALEGIGHPDALNALKRVVCDPAAPLSRREQCVAGLARSRAPSHLELVIEAAERWPELRHQVALSFGAFTEDRRKAAMAIGKSPDLYREILAQLPGNLRYLWGWKTTGNLLNDADPLAVRGAVLLLGSSGDRQAVPGLRRLAASTDDVALKALAEEAISKLAK